VRRGTGFLIEEYSLYDPSIEIICFVGGYKVRPSACKKLL